MDVINIQTLRLYEEEGWIRSQTHPTEDAIIWNYTRATQFEDFWDRITLVCRGLITNSKGKIRGRPFKKFFNLSEDKDPIPDEPFDAYKKLDGSLIILADGLVASRGSFTSEQSLKAKYLLETKYKNVVLHPELTYCCEIIYPENRIVVDYGDEEKLVLLAIFDTRSGEELELIDIGFPVADKISCSSFRDLPQLPNEEGYVLRFKSGLRVKIKNDEYVRLHKILTGFSELSVWEALSSGTPINLENIPDEFDKWLKATQLKILAQYNDIAIEAMDAFGKLDKNLLRKELAEEISYEKPYLRPILFCMLDGKNFTKIIWKLIRPSGEKMEWCGKGPVEEDTS